jgi:ectoine hydroxylase-related dioxygenase (phytanoyl-CoA dioxygenase family)
MDVAELVTNELVAAYSRDGAVCLRGAFGPEWIATLTTGIERNIAEPSDRSRFWDRDADGRTTFYDSQSWLHIPEYRDFAFRSDMAGIAGRLMEVEAVNFFFDAVFVRSAGTRFRTPFHQDEPYWSVEGFETCSAWMPLVPVAKVSALEFVRGSHRWPAFRQIDWGSVNGDTRDQVVYDDGDDRSPFPDIEGDRDSYEILSWDMEPGDVVVFNGRMVHGGSGNLAPDRDLKVFNTQWLGDDVRVLFRPEGMSPDHSAAMTAAGLSSGDRIGTDLYPQLWRREPVPA